MYYDNIKEYLSDLYIDKNAYECANKTNTNDYKSILNRIEQIEKKYANYLNKHHKP